MLNFRVADLDAMLLQLRAAGVRVEPEIEESPYGRFGWTVDPEGRRIELWEPPAAEARPSRGIRWPDLVASQAGWLPVGHIDVNRVGFVLPDGRVLLDEVTLPRR